MEKNKVRTFNPNAQELETISMEDLVACPMVYSEEYVEEMRKEIAELENDKKYLGNLLNSPEYAKGSKLWKCFIKGKYSPWHLHWIAWGLMENLDVDKYLKPGIADEYLVRIVKAVKKGWDVSRLVEPNLSVWEFEKRCAELIEENK